MSERTFRAVIAAVLVGALALAAIVVIAVLPPRAPEPSPGPSVATSGTLGPTETSTPTPTQTPVPTPTPTPPPVFATVEVTGVGQILRGSSSAKTLVLQFTESGDAAIPDAPGTFWVTLTDSGGDGSTVAFEGVPVLAGPDSLGATAALAAPNVLQISIAASDIHNVEPIRITGLGISTSSTAAVGALRAELSHFTGSLAGGAPSNVLASPGTVIAGQ